MNAELADTIAVLLKSGTGGAKLKVGLLFQTKPTVAQKIAAAGHRSIVVGDRFPLLYRIYRKARKLPGEKPGVIEARLDSLPIRSRSLDALVLLCRVPVESAAKTELRVFRDLLKDMGLLVWPHPVTDGLGAKVLSFASPFRSRTYNRAARHQLCVLVMESGFREVGQVVVQGRLSPWVVTTARAAPRPFDDK
jgi:hypothetical protein